MPKRKPVPPPPDDERYFAVWNPFPRLANMELPGDHQSFARWFACVLGTPEPFHAIFHKPTSPGIVIVEVDKNFKKAYGGTGWKRILGEHKWADVLRKPEAEERDLVTRIFFSFYSNAHEVEKIGWKRIYVQDAWFEGWHANNEYITFPYPETSWCATPSQHEDPTNYKLCRALPVVIHPPPAQAAPPPVGSPAYYELKAKEKLRIGPPVIDARSVTHASRLNTKTGKGKKKSTANGTVSDANKTPASSVWGIDLGESVKNGGDSGSSGPWATMTKANGKASAAPTYSSNGWGNMQANGSGKAPASKASATPSSWTSGPPGLSKPTSHPLTPPGLPPKPQNKSKSFFSSSPAASSNNTRSTSPLNLDAPTSNWADEVELQSMINGGGGNSDGSRSQSRSASVTGSIYTGSRPHSAWNPYEGDEDDDVDGPNANGVFTTPSIRPQSSLAPFSDHDLPSQGGVSVLGNPHDVQDWEDGASVVGQNDGKKEEWVCSIHGPILCTKGICQEYTKEKRRKEREQKDKERAASMASNTGKRGRNKKKAGATGASTSGGELGRNDRSNVASDDDLQRAGSRTGSVNSRTTTNRPTASSTARTPSPDEELQSNTSSLSKNPPAPRSSASSQSPSQSDGGGSDTSTPVTSTQGQDDNKDDGDSWSRFGIDEEDEDEDEVDFGVPTATNVVVMRAVVDEGATPLMNNGWDDAQSADESGAAPSNTVKPDDPWGDTPTKTMKGTTTTTTTIPAIWPSRDRTATLNPGAPPYKPWTAPYTPSSPKESPPMPSSTHYDGPTPTKNSWKTPKKAGPVVQEGGDWKSGPRKVWDTGSAAGRSLINGNANSNEVENDGWGHVSKGPWDDPDPVPSGGQGRSKGVGGWNAPVSSGGSKQRGDDGWGAGSSSSGGSGGGGWKTQARVGGGNGGGNGNGGKGKKSKGKGHGGNGGGGGGSGGGSNGNAPGGGRNVPGSSGWSNPNNNSNNAPKPKGWQDNVSVGPW